MAAGARQGDSVLGDRVAFPHDLQLCGVLLCFAIDGHDDVGEDRAQQLLALAIGGGRRVEHFAQVSACLPAPGDLFVGERVGALGGDIDPGALGAPDLGETLFPFVFQGAGDEPVLRLARVELAAGAVGVDLRALELKLGGVHARLVL